MKNQHYLLIALALAYLSFLPTMVTATSWSYAFVVWDGYIYAVTEERVTDIGGEIGQVTKYSDMEQYSGNFSNAYEKGTRYYAIKGVDTEVAIAIEEVNGNYVKAERKKKYEYEGTFFEEPQENLKVFISLLVGILVVFFIYKRLKKNWVKR